MVGCGRRFTEACLEVVGKGRGRRVSIFCGNCIGVMI